MYKGVGDGFSQIMKADGAKGFTVGFLPTWIGYSFQGFGKFGFYEMFKDVYRNSMGTPEKVKKYQTLGFAVSSACAEIIADCFLCPWEAVSTLFIVFFEMFQKIKQLYLNEFLIFLFVMFSLKLKCKPLSQVLSLPVPSRV